MPYTKLNGGFERASPLGHVPTIQHPLVQETLGRYRKPASRTEDVGAIQERLVDPSLLEQEATAVRWVVATTRAHSSTRSTRPSPRPGSCSCRWRPCSST